MPRDEFSASVKDVLSKRVGLRCSNPTCRTATSGPHTKSSRYINLGVASHITAASSGGPRFDADIAPEERASIDNAIWLCQSCAKLIDSDSEKFTVTVLKNWKILAEAKALQTLSGTQDPEYFPQSSSATHAPIPKIAGLTYDGARSKLMDAGWQPRLHHWSYANEPDLQCGNGIYFWGKGYHEIINAAGTGLSQCTFGFQDVYGHILVIVTAGEICEQLEDNAYVWRWYFTTEEA